MSVLRDPTTNKDLGFSKKERQDLGIDGFLPPAVETLDQQIHRAYSQFKEYCHSDLERFMYLRALQDNNERLYFGLLLKYTLEMLPFVYTPTVGAACVNWSKIWPSQTRGLYLTKEHRGKIGNILHHYAKQRPEIDIIVFSDGSRILGLGDIACNGMGIPIGKLNLYVAGAGFDPAKCLPVLLDTGCTRKEIIEDPLYVGDRISKLSGDDFYGLVDEFIREASAKWPKVVLQFEDFSNNTAFPLLEKYQHEYPAFNDDIQGTGAVIAAGVFNAVRVSQRKLDEEKIVFMGAGSAAVGVADLIVDLMVRETGVSVEHGRKRCLLVDSEGLVTSTRQGRPLAGHKIPYAHDTGYEATTLKEVVEVAKPTMLIGLCTRPGVFTKDIIQELNKHCERPIIMALSNPTTKMECFAAQAYEWTDGKCIFASGSPQPDFEWKGKVYSPGQGNNMYVFPGIGLGLSLAQAKRLPQSALYAAIKSLALATPVEKLEQGNMYPCLSDIRNISATIAAAVMQSCFDENVAQLSPKPENLREYAQQRQWVPEY